MLPRLPGGHLKPNRGAAKGMIEPPDPKAERVRARKAKAAERRYMTHETYGHAVKLHICGKPLPAEPISEECHRCLAEKQKVLAA